MGSGYRTFTAGEVLTASNVQNYLQDQSVMVFGGSAARSSAIGTANFEEGMVSYLTDTDKVEAYDGTNWLEIGGSSGGGKVVQIVFANTVTGASNSTNVMADTNLTATITPTSASNKVLVLMNQNGCGKKTNNTVLRLRLMRGATQIALGTGIGGFSNNSNDNFFNNVSLSFLDEPATTSATTYKTQFDSSGNNARADVQSDSSMSTIVLMEVTP
jgi:hypothetical protein